MRNTISDNEVTTTVNVLVSGWRHDLIFDAMAENELLVISHSRSGETSTRMFGGRQPHSNPNFRKNWMGTVR